MRFKKPPSKDAPNKTVAKKSGRASAQPSPKKPVTPKALEKPASGSPAGRLHPSRKAAVSAKPKQPSTESVRVATTTGELTSDVPKEPSRLLASYEPTVDEGAHPGHFPNDEVMDETDQAQYLQLQEQAAISLRARELNRPETHPDFDGKTCVECGDPMPAERLALCRVRCVHCQTFLEEDARRRQRTVA